MNGVVKFLWKLKKNVCFFCVVFFFFLGGGVG